MELDEEELEATKALYNKLIKYKFKTKQSDNKPQKSEEDKEEEEER